MLTTCSSWASSRSCDVVGQRRRVELDRVVTRAGQLDLEATVGVGRDGADLRAVRADDRQLDALDGHPGRLAVLLDLVAHVAADQLTAALLRARRPQRHAEDGDAGDSDAAQQSADQRTSHPLRALGSVSKRAPPARVGGTVACATGVRGGPPRPLHTMVTRGGQLAARVVARARAAPSIHGRADLARSVPDHHRRRPRPARRHRRHRCRGAPHRLRPGVRRLAELQRRAARRRVLDARRHRAGQPPLHRPRRVRRDRRRARLAVAPAAPARPDVAVARPRRRGARPDRARRDHRAGRPPPGRRAGPHAAVAGARRRSPSCCCDAPASPTATAAASSPGRPPA